MRLTVATLIAVLLAGILVAQVPPVQQQPTFRTGVSYVRVDAYPTQNGRAVGGLGRQDFEVLEDGVPQAIATFEHVVVRPAGAESARAEPATARESDDAAANPRNRLFVLFFDTYHTSGYGMPIGAPDMAGLGRTLASFLQQLIGPDDLIAVMRPETPASTLAFTRRPSSFEDFLLSGGEWQRRFLEQEVDNIERRYTVCYLDKPAIYKEMIARRREAMVLDALRNLVRRLGNLREERKAILLISWGWELFVPNESLARPLDDRVPGSPKIGVDRGMPDLGAPHENVHMADCDRDRLMLARADHEREFRTLVGDANRANATFYPVDPYGLRSTSFSRSQESLRSLASATDGIPVMDSNDIGRGLQRIAADLSSYYLLGYNSTNTKFDGRFRKITVRVRRPGVSVRARPGYVAPTEEEVTARAAASVEKPVDPETVAVRSALAALVDARPDRVIHARGGYAWSGATVTPPGAAGSVPVAPGAPAPGRLHLWFVGELDAAMARKPVVPEDIPMSVAVQDAAGRTLATQRATVSATSRTCVVRFAGIPVGAGEYSLRVITQASSQPVTETVRVVVPAAEGMLGQAVLFRRGPYTGPVFQPTADVRFRKAERVRADVAVPAKPDSVTARLLDRRGQALPILVTVADREDGGLQYATAEIALAPLALGDYVVEVVARFGGREEKTRVAFRIVP